MPQLGKRETSDSNNLLAAELERGKHSMNIIT